jgi:hypothetical protein
MMRGVAGLWVFLLIGCSSDSPPVAETVAWTVVTESSMTTEQAAQRDHALAARDALFQRLMTRLGQVLSAEGPAAAIPVCQVEAPQLASAVAQEYTLAIGRTSDQLRNPGNLPPVWAETVLATRPSNPTFLTSADGKLGAILPIRLKTQCLTCHGPKDKIPSAVHEALIQRYPADQATGYAENDLRGWFWVEVPVRKSS